MCKFREFLLALAAVVPCTATVAVAQDVAGEWVMFRGGMERQGVQQPTASLAAFADPTKVQTLGVAWWFVGPAPFVASPVVYNGLVYIGDTSGEFWAIDSGAGTVKWKYPDPTTNPNDPTSLIGLCNPWGNVGIQASAVVTTVVNSEGAAEKAVVFGAEDPDSQTDYGNGSSRLWALDANTGALIWKSDVVAHVTGQNCNNPPPGGSFPPGALLTSQSGSSSPPNSNTPQYHEMIKWSSPLAVITNPSTPLQPDSGYIFVGISSAEDPLQLGGVRAVNLSGRIVQGAIPPPTTSGEWAVTYSELFPTRVIHSLPTPQMGGSVWNGPASDGSGVFFTTGNTRNWNSTVTPVSYNCYLNGVPVTVGGPGVVCYGPPVNYGLSAVRTDFSGNVQWFFQPLPLHLDNDPDWNAGATVMNTSCGELIASVMKDGWSYAIDANSGSCAWQFPDMKYTPPCTFSSTNTLYHGSEGFRTPGAAWGNYFIVATGGYALPTNSPTSQFTEGILHSLQVCQPGTDGNEPLVSWIYDFAANTPSAVCSNPSDCNTNPMNTPGEDAMGAPTVLGGLIYVPTNQGHVVVLADPTVVAPAGQTCNNTADADCSKAPDAPVPIPKTIVDLPLCIPSAGCDAAHFRKEVVLAESYAFGSLCVGSCDPTSTSWGLIYALTTGVSTKPKFPTPPIRTCRAPFCQ
jgi:hypothetical protein